MTLHLVWAGADLPDEPEGPWEAARRLAAGLWLVADGAGRSPTYHAFKDLLPAGTPLVVAPLADAPKMAHVAPGSVSWARGRTAGA